MSGQYTGDAADINSLGLIRFHPDNIGETVSVTYTYVDAYQEIWGSVQDLKEVGALTTKAVYLTGRPNMAPLSAHMAAKEDGITICSNQYFPTFEVTNDIMGGTAKKMPLKTGTMLMHEWMGRVDTAFFQTTQEDAYDSVTPGIINSAKELSLPVVGYIHDFFASEYHTSGIWNKAESIDWKGSTIGETRENIYDFYMYFLGLLNAENVYWITRSEYEKRYNYLNKHLQYHVEGNEVYIKNTGNEAVKGITFKFDTNTTPKGVQMGRKVDVDWVYDGTNKRAIAWFDLLPGQSLTLQMIS